MLNSLKALAIFTGTIIGVGIFGLPYIASKASFFVVFLFFLLITVIVTIVHLLFAKVCLGTKNIHRLPGYVNEYFGKPWGKITVLITGLGITGASLAYLIVGGEFLKFLFSPYFGGSAVVYGLLFFCLGAYFIFRGIRSISIFELLLLLVLFVILLIFFARALPFITIENLQTSVLDWRFLAMPYGVILFSLWGLSVVPALKEIICRDFLSGKIDIKTNKKRVNKVIIYGILIAALAYLFFIFIILGVCGGDTSKDAMSGFSQTLGNSVISLGFIFGLIACFTSFITLGLVFKKTLWYDFGLPKNLSWFIVCFLPLFFYLLGFKEFIEIVGFTGALSIGLEGVIVILLYKAFLKKKFSRKMNPLLYILPVFFILGIALEIFYFLVK
ncbi:amino acid permease [Candidatus Parcubacteria bacterium]|nr:amino acid permease [Candidatus Parcubacteria bacterium]